MTSAAPDRFDKLADEIEALGRRIRALLILIADFEAGRGAPDARSEIIAEAASALAGRRADGATGGVGVAAPLVQPSTTPTLTKQTMAPDDVHD